MRDGLPLAAATPETIIHYCPLHAAAPDLLEALKEEHRMAGFCSEPENCITARALAKAEGR